MKIKGIPNIEEKLNGDRKRRDAYKNYQKYKKMLEIYNNPKEKKLLLKNTFAPFSIAGKSAKKKDIDSKEFEAFCEKVDQLKNDNPNIELTTLYTHKGREIIGDIISDSFDKNFKNADLESVAVAECFGLYNSLDKAQNKDNNEKVKILIDNQVPIPLYQKACKNLENYKKVERKEWYDKIHKKNGGSQDIIHITAAALQIGPAEAEESLKAFEVIKGKENSFDRELKVDLDYYENEDWYNIIYQAESKIDEIMIDDSKTEVEKNALINEQKIKISTIQKLIANVKKRNEDKMYRVKREQAKYNARHNGDKEQELA